MKHFSKLVHRILQESKGTHEAAEHSAQEHRGQQQRSQEAEDIALISGEQHREMGQTVTA